MSEERRLKSLFLTTWYPTKQQPIAGVFVREHAKAVQLYDDVVVLHCAGFSSNPKGLSRIERDTDEGLSQGIVTYRVWHLRSPIPKTSFFLQLWGSFRAFRHIVATGFYPDIIHAHVHNAGFLAAMLGRYYHIPVVITEQSTGFPRKLLKGLDVWKAKLAFKWADTVMPVSRSLMQAIEAYGIRARFRIIPNVVDTRQFYPAASPQLGTELKHLLVVSLLDSSHKKGLPYLFHALAQLQNHRSDWHLDVVGDGPARAEYESLTMDLGIADKISFHGLKPKAEVAEFMRRADIFVLPSIWDNLPCVVIEAMASGLPIVSTLAGGIPEMVDAETGYLVPPGDAEHLSTAIAGMMETLGKFDRRMIAQKARRYSPEAVGSLIHAVYQDCIKNDGSIYPAS
jgi:glycosyltransferase involved in cell wall biosynthesis